MKVRILNWHLYNAKRTDVKSTSWFRMENKFAQSQSLYGVPAVGRYVFFTLLALASERQENELKFDLGWFLHFHGAGAYSQAEFISALELLHEKKTIEVLEWPPEASVTDTERARDEDGTDPSRYGRTGRDGTDERATTTTETENENSEESELLGPVPLLAGTPGSDMLRDVTHRAQKAWVTGYGLEVVKEQLPLAVAKWESDPERARKGNWPLYLANWFQREVKAAKAKKIAPTAGARAGPGKPPLRKTGKPCEESFATEYGVPMAKRTCIAHSGNEICEVEGRLG